jgi:simple sugar transport system substrate-binding protein
MWEWLGMKHPAGVRRASVFLACLLGCGVGPNSVPAERADTRIVVVTHGQSSDPFWSVVANGVDDAAKELALRVEYQAPTSFDMVRMSQLIDAAVASRPAGLIVSVPDADALGASVRAAVAAGIPTLSINAGGESWRKLGLLAHIGQTEYEAGVAAGERLASAGAKRVLCVNHEVGNVSLDLRCRGLADALKKAGAAMRVVGVSLADPEDATQRISGALGSAPAADGILALGPAGAVPTLAALRQAGRMGEVAAGTFDLSPDVLAAVRGGALLFAIDQQPYLQGYLGVVFLAKYLTTRAVPGGGEIVRTGPSFVTRENVSDVIGLTEQGVR